MSLSTTSPSSTAAAPPPITCPLYSAAQGGPRCLHYRGAGICGVHVRRLEECTEWRKINPTLPTPAPVLQQRDADPSGEASAGLPLFDRSAAGTAPGGGAVTAPSCVADASASTALAAATFSRVPTDEDIASFKALGAEICIRCDAGELWIVPEYRDATRREVSVEHVAKILLVTSAFPGANVRAVVPVPPEVA